MIRYINLFNSIWLFGKTGGLFPRQNAGWIPALLNPEGDPEMSKVCEICGKKPVVGYNVSHAHNKTKKRWYPNLQKVRSVQNGQTRRILVCTSCIKSGRVTKP